MFEKLKLKKAIRQDWKLLKKLKCSCCGDNPKICDKHCILLMEQIKHKQTLLDYDK